MIKESQSLLDFVNIFPLQAINVRRSPISNKEATALFNIWQGKRDEYGNVIVPENTDPIVVAALTSKGLVKNKPIHFAEDRLLEITKKGKEVIRNIILFAEKSVFEKSTKNINYEKIHMALNDAPVVRQSEKIASKTLPENYIKINWLQKIKCKYF